MISVGTVMALHIHRRDHGFESSGSQKIQAPVVA